MFFKAARGKKEGMEVRELASLCYRLILYGKTQGLKDLLESIWLFGRGSETRPRHLCVQSCFQTLNSLCPLLMLSFKISLSQAGSYLQSRRRSPSYFADMKKCS